MPQTHIISPPCDAQALAAESDILPVSTGMTLLRPVEHRIQLGIPFNADLCPAGFPSPAIFPYGADCQLSKNRRNRLKFIGFKSEVVRNYSLIPLTIVNVLKAFYRGAVYLQATRLQASSHLLYRSFH